MVSIGLSSLPPSASNPPFAHRVFSRSALPWSGRTLRTSPPLARSLPQANPTFSEYYATLDYVREHGVTQFLNIYNQVKSRTNDDLLWGDELEYHLFCRDNQTGELRVANLAHEVLAQLESEDQANPAQAACTWHPEFGAWMVEATPSKPYSGFASDLKSVEANMRLRRHRVGLALKRLEQKYGMEFGICSMVAWPRLGVQDFTFPPNQQIATGTNQVSQSLFIPDECINPHPRFATLVRNIRKRRGEKVDIHMPLFVDSQTSSVVANGKEEDIYMDAMGFGMGMCCLQVTFQARDLDESRFLYDQLAVLCPLFLALTAGCPVLKGQIADTDVRWSVIAQSVDCRTREERSLMPTNPLQKHSHGPIRKSRYDSVDVYMSTHKSFKPKYNDLDTEYDQASYDRLTKSGVDPTLAKHVAHLFVRDPLVIFSERVDQVDDSKSTEHFENIQSTNWQTMRWKPPPNAQSMGWRVEFRPMEVQFTDFENAAFTVVVMLCARVILFFDLNLYLPLSKVDENMKRAHTRDAVLKESFFFRKRLVVLQSQCNGVEEEDDDAFEEMKLEDIFLGKGEAFPGLVPLIWAYLDVIGIDPDTRSLVEDYIDLVVRRAKGELPTPAKWMRNFLTKHPKYQHDSQVNAEMCRDLVNEVEKLANGTRSGEDLLGSSRHASFPLDSNGGEEEEAKEEMPPSKPLGRALRGSSFHTQLGTTPGSIYQCAIVRSLVEKYRQGGSPQSNPSLAKESIISEARTFTQTKPLIY
ncbi:hypothetical protein BASA81_005937 [Batrachochytrium salamandrivorans]|nr:hypothetical protein BASA81_005937 [Batrachochytrium salamandrivorans]